MKTLHIISYTFLTLLTSLQVSYATNGMNLEGYGPEGTAMGGTSMAWDNGTAAVMNNPATLILQDSENRLDLALGMLGPDVKAEAFGMTTKSSGDAYFMPALGYIRRSGDLAYGLAVFGQGGMGTKFSSESFLAMGSGLPIKSEVSVGRLIAPLAWKINDKLTLAATADFVWAGMDMQMAMNGDQFADMTTPGMMNSGMASGSLLNDMMPFMMAGYQLDYAHFNFCDGSAFTGAAKGFGYAGKLGLLYEFNDQLTWGLSYHSESRLSDLDTDHATISMQLSNAAPPPGYPPVFPTSITGTLDVVNFQWPSTYGTGIAYRPDDKWLLTADIKCINWSDTMENFRMVFTADQSASNDLTAMGGPDMRGNVLDATIFQHWDDQWVFALGAAYKSSDQWTWRLGINHGDNPVPAQYVHPLFPAIVETHITGGFTYQPDPGSQISLSLTYGMNKKVPTPTANGPLVSMHKQTNFQLMYTRMW